jgi:hypothetical protein
MVTDQLMRDDEIKLANGTAILLDADETTLIITRKDGVYRLAFWDTTTIDEWFSYLNSNRSDWANKAEREVEKIPHPIRVYDFDDKFDSRELVPVED